MVTPELAEYIRQGNSLGTSRDQINSQLLTQGWAQSDIDSAWEQVNSLDSTQPPPKKNWLLKLIIGTKLTWVATFILVGIFAVITYLNYGVLPRVEESKLELLSRDATRKADLSNIYRVGLDSYFNDNKEYPVSNGSVDSTYPSPTGIFSTASPLISKGYVSRVPADPSNGRTNCKLTSVSESQICAYKYLADKDSFVIWIILEIPSTSGGVFLIRSDGSSATTDKEPLSP